MKQLFLGMAAAGMFFTACKKAAEPTSIEGVVRTAGTTNGLAGLKVNLVLDNGTGLAGNLEDNFGVEASTVTDENGHYRLDHRCYQSNSYYVEFEAAPEHWGPVSRKRVKVGEHNQQDVNQIPFAWVNFHIKNVNPYNSEDVIVFQLSPGGGGQYQGRGIDLYTKRKAGGNIRSVLYYAFKKNQTWTEKYDTLYIPAYDTLDYQIFY